MFLSLYAQSGSQFRYWTAFPRQGFNSSFHYELEDFETNRQRNGFTVMMNFYRSVEWNDKVIYVFKNSDPTSTVVRFKINSRVGSEYNALAMNYTDKIPINFYGCVSGSATSINDTFFQTDFAKTKTIGLISYFNGDTLDTYYGGRIFVVNKDSENSSFPIFIDTAVACLQLASNDWELIIKPFDRSFPTKLVATGSPVVNTDPNQNAYYIAPTEFEDNDQKFAMLFALTPDNYGMWTPRIKYLPHENFCPQLDEESLVEFNGYRPGETFEQISYPDGCLQGDAHNIIVQTQLCNETPTDFSNLLFGNESQINEQGEGLFVFWERMENGKIFAVYSCDSIAFNHTSNLNHLVFFSRVVFCYDLMVRQVLIKSLQANVSSKKLKL